MYYIPDPTWFKILLVLLPVIAAFTGVVLTNWNNRKIQDARIASEKEDRELVARRTAAHEIFTLMESWAADMRKSGIVLAGAVGRGEPTPDSDHRIIMDSSRYLRARMLVTVHFPHLEPSWKAALVEQEKILTASITSEAGGRTPEQRKQDALNATHALGAKTLDLLKSVTADLKQLHS
jgi:hypothetical protein